MITDHFPIEAVHRLLKAERGIRWLRHPGELLYVREGIISVPDLSSEVDAYWTLAACEVIAYAEYEPLAKLTAQPMRRAFWICHKAGQLDGVDLPPLTDDAYRGTPVVVEPKQTTIRAGRLSEAGWSKRDITAEEIGTAVGARDFALSLWQSEHDRDERVRARAAEIARAKAVRPSHPYKAS